MFDSTIVFFNFSETSILIAWNYAIIILILQVGVFIGALLTSSLYVSWEGGVHEVTEDNLQEE